MIEPLDIQVSGVFPLAKEVKEKINELINAFNEHYHESLDTHYNTTGPKFEN